jgi:hypothetical protein
MLRLHCDVINKAGFSAGVAKWRDEKMALSPDQSPLFRRIILPWYDTDVACVLTGIFLLLVFGFALAGISVAFETPDSGRHAWLPSVLLVLSVAGIVTVCLRLYRRHAHRFKRDLP